MGFEPTVHLSAYTHLAGEHLQPLGHLSVIYGTQNQVQCNLAEGVGFEPTVPFGTAVFKTAALNHSAIPPKSLPIIMKARLTRKVEND